MSRRKFFRCHYPRARTQWLQKDAPPTRPQGFIETASRCYVHALQHEEAGIPDLVDLYAKIDRMRIVSSAKVIEIAERFARKIVDTRSEPNERFIELREMTNSNPVNVMREFSTARRAELETLRTV